MNTLSPSRTFRIALIGNPNVGKTSLFNALTGLSARVGNYPGVTVEKKRGVLQVAGQSVEVVDLPGIYALSPHAPDEVVAFSVLTGKTFDHPLDGLLVVVDASNLERNLYLFSQLLELKLPTVIALTMEDVARAQGITIDVARLSERLGVPVVPVHAASRNGLDRVKGAIGAMLAHPEAPAVQPPVLGSAIEQEISTLQVLMRERGRVPWCPLLIERALIDRGGHMEREFEAAFGREALEASRARIPARPVLAAEEARVRYAWVHERLAGGILERPAVPVRTFSDRLDALLTHRIAGMLCFALIMAGLFQAVYAGAAPLQDGVDHAFKALGNLIASHMAPGALESLIVDGVIAGVGTVLTFLPQIAILFLLIGLLEDCGYMARAAFLMDKVMSKAGLSGKSFIPMLSGFACAVPSIMATRTIENRKDRLATILALPLMSCSARLPVYTLMIGAFVPVRGPGGLDGRGLTLTAFYMLGVVVAIPLIWLLKRTVLAGDTPTLVMELPTYKTPSLRVVGIRVWQQVRSFLERAGTTIVLVAIVIWAGAYFPHRAAVGQPFDAQRASVSARAHPDRAAVARVNAAEAAAYVEDSYLARVGKAIEPAFAPLGWDWRVTTGVLSSFPARETIVATLGTLYSLGDEASEASLKDALVHARRADGRPEINLPVAMSVLVFFALCLQCASTLVVMWRETGSWRWPAFAFTTQTALAYVAALVTYRLLLGGF